MNQADPKLNRVAVLMLGVKDLPRAVAFYRDVLGLEPQGEVAGDFVFFNGGGVTIVLSVPHADPKISPHIVGATEVVFGVESVTAAYEALRARGVGFTRAPRPVAGPNWGANFTDPDGHRLSLFGPEKGS
jgi:catechol 2,3-dioxygenase-like lactoylglutathione lyase family enzyme